MKNSVIVRASILIFLESACLIFVYNYAISSLNLGVIPAAAACAVLLLAATGLTLYLNLRSYSRLLGEIKRNLSEFCRGNFIVEFKPGINSTDAAQLKENFQTLQNMLNTWIYELLHSSVSIKISARRISNSSKKAEDGMVELTENLSGIRLFVEETTASFEEVAVETEQLTRDSRSIAGNSSEATDRIKEASVMVREGGGAVTRVTESMHQIESDVAESSRVMERLETVSNEIGYIASTISDISEQTNLLALNAAIESARAGEAGRGFAVVADQVRKLADETNQAAGKIRELIRSVQDETQSAVSVMRKVTQEVAVGAEVASKAGNYLEKMIPTVEHVAGVMAAISAEVNSQSRSTGVISQNTSEVASKGQTSASSLQEITNIMTQQLDSVRKNTESSNKLLDLSVKLEDVMEKFDGIIGEEMLAIADSLAKILEQRLLSNEEVTQIAKATGLNEIHVANSDGKVIISTDKALLGYEFRLEKANHVKDFLPILDDPSVRVNQKAKFRGSDGALYKFVGISTLGSPGIIECGLDASTMVYFRGLDAMKQIQHTYFQGK